jgi:hypothetical protein
MLQAGLADVKSLSSTSTISARGFVSNPKMDLSRLTNPQLAQMVGSMSASMNSMAMPMPEEPVGVGAKWTVRQALPSSGLTVFQEVQVELTAADEHSATLSIKLAQTAPPQAVQNPSLPAGVQARLEQFTGSGTATTKVQFDSLVPTSDGTSKTNTTMSVDAGTGVQQIGVNLTVKSKVTPIK